MRGTLAKFEPTPFDVLLLELVATERPDLVVSDIMMPVLNGAELCRRLKA